MALPRRQNKTLQDKVEKSLDIVAAVAATTTFALGLTDGDYYVDKFELITPTTYAADPANFYVITLQKGATVLATWSTQTSAQGALTANTPANGVLAAAFAGAKGDTLQVVCTKNGTAANLPAQFRVTAKLHQL